MILYKEVTGVLSLKSAVSFSSNFAKSPVDLLTVSTIIFLGVLRDLRTQMVLGLAKHTGVRTLAELLPQGTLVVIP